MPLQFEIMIVSSRRVGVDIGGSWIRIRCLPVTEDNSPLEVIRTPPTANRIAEELLAGINRLLPNTETRRYAFIACTGLVANGSVIASVNLPTPLHLKRYLLRNNIEAYVINDAQAQGLGATTGLDSLIYISIGTGVGGAIILNAIFTEGPEDSRVNLGISPHSQSALSAHAAREGV